MSNRNDSQIHVIDIDRYGFVAVLMALFAYRRWLVTIMAIAVLGAIAYWKLAPPVYRAEATFLPSSKILGDEDLAQMGALRSAALSLGVSVSGGKADPSLLFEGVLKSRTMTSRALSARLANSKLDTVMVLDAIGVKGISLSERMYKGNKYLRRNTLRTSVDVRTGITKISVASSDPVLAANLANFIVATLDSFSRNAKVEFAGRQVTFISGRLSEIQSTLKAAENELRRFRSDNRVTNASPELLLEQSRFERDVHLNEQLYVTLRTQLEVARIEEVKSFPVLMSIDRAISPPVREAPRLGKTLILFVVVAFGFAAVLVLVVDYIRSANGTLALSLFRKGIAADRQKFLGRSGAR